MDNIPELLCIVDENNNELAPSLRNKAIEEKLWRRAAGGIILNPRNACIFCHQRSSLKDERPGKWVATFGGKVMHGETVIDSAKRELKEEFGLKSNTEDLVFAGCFKVESRRQFEYVFVLFKAIELTDIVIDHNEVQNLCWLNFNDCKTALSKNDQWFAYGYEIPLITQIEIIQNRMLLHADKFSYLNFEVPTINPLFKLQTHTANQILDMFQRFLNK